MSIILTITSSESCTVFESAFLVSLLVDFAVVQPLVMAFTYLYRWLTSDEDDTIWSELHPYDGEERDL